ncbi:hypothetical protein DSO57_1006410 [Entomophthora muscae]|uniref:Uncharacterized protein n=1 Tax=Entomophthora muscae TaxID=34485 RepID=A0ACC2UH20_9FUNG|nr:hypothetical protein DSO57_1006410 [Entomophthora muscae]
MLFNISLLPLLLVVGKNLQRQVIDGVDYYLDREVIQKNPSDHREYQGLWLNNQMKVLLISDPKERYAAVSLQIPKGGLNDPDNVPGLAHLIEHMLYQGGKKYPRRHLREVLNTNDGNGDAYTFHEYATYFYNLGNWALEESLDSFVNRFVEPVFNKTIAFGEASAVNYEHQWRREKIPHDFHQYLLAKETSKKRPYFVLGNYDTLITKPKKQGLDISQLLSTFHQKHYSSNIMNLVVIGKESIKDLAKLVVPRFSKIPNHNLQPRSNKMPYYGRKISHDFMINYGDRPKMMKIDFYFSFPNMHILRPYLEYIISLFALAGNGSFIEIMASRNLAEKTKTESDFGKDFAYFTVINSISNSINPSKEEVLKVVFAYIDAIRTQRVDHKRFQAYIEKTSTASLTLLTRDVAQSLSIKLQESPGFEDILGYPKENPKASEDLLKKAIDLFTTNNFAFYNFKPYNGSYTPDPWFGLNYSLSKFNRTFLKALSLSKAEDYKITIPEDKSTTAKASRNDSKSESKVVVLKNNYVGHVKSFTVDSSVGSYFELELDFQYNTAPKLLPCLDLLEKLLDDLLVKTTDPCDNQTSKQSIQIQKQSIFLVLENQTDFQNLVTSFAKSAMNYNLTLESFKALKDEVVIYFSTRPRSNYTSTQDMVNAQLNTFNRDNVLRAKAASGTTFQEFKAFMDSFHKTLRFNVIGSSRTSGKVLTQIKTQLESIFRLNPCNTKYLKNKYRPLPINGNFVRVEKEPQEISLTTVYLHLYDSNEVEEAAMTLATAALFNRRYAYQLRTIEHLAYRLFAYRLKIGSSGGMILTIESDQPGVYLESRIEAFLEQFAGQVKGISNKSLNKTLAGLVNVQKGFLANAKPNPSNSWKVIQETIATREQRKLNYIPS